MALSRLTQINAATSIQAGVTTTLYTAVGVYSGGQTVGTGITQLNFIGAGNTFLQRGNVIDVAISGNATSDVVDDTTPQLGGNLDLNSKYITGTGGANVTGVVTARELVATVGANVTGVVTATDIKATNFVQVLGAGGQSDRGIEARSNSSQATDTNKALRVRNNSNTNTFAVSYKGRVDADEYHGKFIGDGSGITGVTASGSGINVRDNGAIVGVAGTVNFGSNLDVSNASAGFVTVTQSTTGVTTSTMFHVTGSGSSISSPGTNILTFGTNGEERVRLTASGELGIGTAIPGRAGANELTVASPTGDSGITIRSGAAAEGNIYFADSDQAGHGQQRGVIRFDHDGDDMTFWTASGSNWPTEKLRITDAGRLGIGDDDPSVIVSIKDAAPKIKFIDSDATGTPETLLDGSGGDLILDIDKDNEKSSTLFAVKIDGSEKLRIDSSGLIANNNRNPSGYGSPNLLISGTDSTLTLMGDGSSNGSSYTGIKFRVAGASTGDYTKAGIFSRREGGYNDLSLIFALDTVADATSVAISDEKMRITSAGKVGVGSANPRGSLDLWGDGSAYPTLRLGTEVYQTEGEDIRFGRTDFGSNDIRYHSIWSKHDGSAATNYLQFRVHDAAGSPHTTQANVLTLRGDSKVGINTAEPGYALEVLDTGLARIRIKNKSTASGSYSSLNMKTENSDWSIYTEGSSGAGNYLRFFDVGGHGTVMRLTGGSGTQAGHVSVGDQSGNYEDSPLEVRGTAAGGNIAMRVTNNTTNNGSMSGIIFTTTTADFTSAAIAHKRNDNALIFFNGQSAGAGGFDNATEVGRFTSTGQFSIAPAGTSIDSNTVLHVERNGESNTILAGNNAGAGCNLFLRNHSASSDPRCTIGGLDAGGQGTSSIEFWNNDNSTNEGEMRIKTRPASGSQTTRMRFKSDGNIAIIDTSATVLDADNALQINGTNNTNNIDLLRLRNTGGSPNTEVGMLFENGVDIMARISSWHDASDLGGLKFWTSSTRDNPAERLRIGKNGQLGIAGANYGNSGQVIQSKGSGASVEWTDQGIADVDLWHLTSNFAGGADPVSSNISQFSGHDFERLGSGMSLSSGTFTFPKTGVWLVECNRETYANHDDREVRVFIQCTDNNSSYTSRTENANHIARSESQNTHNQTYSMFIFDVVNTSTHKVKFKFTCNDSSTNTIGTSNVARTWFKFTRLGDT